MQLVPHRLFAGDARALWRGDAEAQQALAGAVEETVTRAPGRHDFHTGSSVIDGEWLFATYMMAGMGFGQTALEHPEWRAHHVALMRKCIERILSREVRAFEVAEWGDD